MKARRPMAAEGRLWGMKSGSAQPLVRADRRAAGLCAPPRAGRSHDPGLFCARLGVSVCLTIAAHGA